MTRPELTPDERESLDLLRAALPPISAKLADLDLFDSLVAIDLEWERETGELTCLGVGNEQLVVQLWWRAYTGSERAQARRAVAELIRRVPVVYHNADIDIRQMRANGFDIEVSDHKQLDDTMLAHAVLHSEEEHTLEHLGAQYGKLPPHKHLQKVAPIEYNAADLVQTVVVWKYGLLPELHADPLAHWIYRKLMLPFLPIQIESEEAGIRVNQAEVMPLYEKYVTKIEQACRLAQAYCGWPININSPDQLKVWLYNVEGLPIQRDREDKAVTDKDAIAALRRLHGTEWDADEEPTLEQAWANIEAGGNPLLEARYLFMGAQQALSHYVLPCLHVEGKPPKRKILGVRERVYPECRQHVQATGRHSYVGTDWPGRTGLAVQQLKGPIVADPLSASGKSPALLKLLTPDPGTCWIGHDWSQIEVRILAVEAGDQVYLDAFERGDDIHGLNVRIIFGPPGSADLEETRRRFTKSYVFRLHYRGKPENAGDIPGARALGLDAQRLVDLSRAYLEGHPALPVYWQKIEEEADRTRCVRTFMGRPRRLTSDFRNARNREACNHPMQGGVADIYAETAILVKQAAPWARLVFGAHDAQWWQVPVERRLEFLMLYAPIVEREFTINGRRISFPASYKAREAA